MNIKAIDSICLWSENPDQLARFYKDILGLQVDRVLNLPDDRGTQFKTGDVYFFVGYHDKVFGKNKDPYRTMVGFGVDSVKKAYGELVPKGVEFILGPSPSPDKTFWRATAFDPEGNIIQFFSNDP